MRTNNAVTLSLAQTLLKDADIMFLLADENMSILEGSIGLLPKRLLVDSDEIMRARRLMSDAGLGNELRDKK
jgi:phage-related holin